jgi:hypothetical protein
MTQNRSIPLAIAAAASLALVALATPHPAAAQAVQAGVSSAVRGDVNRASPATGRAARARLAPGQDIFMRDGIDTAAQSMTQLLLLDESTFTLGPQSEVVIDDFVYDPSAAGGVLTASAVKGTFRFISGQIGAVRTPNISIKTPSAVIGVRGTILLTDIVRDAAGAVIEELIVLTGPGAKNNANAVPGRINVTAEGVTESIFRTGWGTFVRPGQPPTAAALIPLEIIARLSGNLSPAVARGQPAGGGMVASGTGLAGQDIAEAAFTGGVVVRQSVDNALAESVVTNSEQQMATTMDVFAFGLSTWGEINALPPSGTASFSQMNVPLFDLAGIADAGDDIDVASQADLDGAIAFVTSLFGSAAGDYDFSFDADLSAKTYELEFSDINVPAIGVSDAKLEQTTGYAGAAGFGFIFIDDTGIALQGLAPVLAPNGIFADAQCKAQGCAGAAIFLNAGGNPLAGAAHALLVGDRYVGGGFAVAR